MKKNNEADGRRQQKAYKSIEPDKSSTPGSLFGGEIPDGVKKRAGKYKGKSLNVHELTASYIQLKRHTTRTSALRASPVDLLRITLP
jgi:hypothetical protein